MMLTIEDLIIQLSKQYISDIEREIAALPRVPAYRWRYTKTGCVVGVIKGGKK